MQTDENSKKTNFTEIISQPSYIKGGQLHDHQLAGLNWLAFSWHSKNNVILADEMGLGKTIQTISFFSYLMNECKVTRPFLLVVPLTTIANWQKELEKWLPNSYVVTLQGNKTARDMIKSQEFYFG